MEKLVELLARQIPAPGAQAVSEALCDRTPATTIGTPA